MKEYKLCKVNFFSCVVFLLLISSLYFNKDNREKVYAESDWSVGNSGVINIEQCTGTGAENWMMDKVVFLFELTDLEPFAQKNGRKNKAREIENLNVSYSNSSIAIIPYDFTNYLDNHGFNELLLLHRISWDSDKFHFYSGKSALESVRKMRKKATGAEGAITNGVYYEQLKKLDKEGTLAKKWSELITNITTGNSELVWSWITKYDSETNKYYVTERIDSYLHIANLNIDPDNMANATPEKIKELKLRYIDLLMTLYGQAKDSMVATEWKTTIEEYIKGNLKLTKSSGNIVISAGFIARGKVNATTAEGKKINDTTNVLGGCQDMLEISFGIDKRFSLGRLETSQTVADALLKEGKKTYYYNRLLKSLQMSVVAQKGQTVKRYYTTDSIFGSPIASRIVNNKPVIKNTIVSWDNKTWNPLNLIEHILLKSKYYGTMLVPAFDGLTEEPKLEATLKIGSSLPDFVDLNFVRYKSFVSCLNDKPKISITLKKGSGSNSAQLWQELLNNNKYFKLQVKFKQTAEGEMNKKPPELVFSYDKYKNPSVTYSNNLEGWLEGRNSFNTWIITSLANQPIEAEELQSYIYQAIVTLYFSNTSNKIDDMNKIEAETKPQTIKYLNTKPDKIQIYGQYVSQPDAYSELKEGSIYNETFEAMAGVPSTRTLYFASGGSEFMVELEVMYDYDKTANRTYRSFFAGGVDCEFKEADNAKTASLGGQTADLHNGGTYTKTWSGSIPNKATAKTALHNATCDAIPDYTAYNAAKTEADKFAQSVNSTTLSYTSGSDKKTRSYNNWGASITTDSKNDPQTTTASVTCKYKPAVIVDGKESSAEVPCANEMATANPGAAGSYTIIVTWNVPAHVICGPCCSHVMSSVEDTWTQEVKFDTLKIVDVRVWKIDSSYVGGMKEITYNEDEYVKATIKQGDPNIFYNIAGSDTSVSGRLRYSLQQGQHDAVTWYERNNKNIETRSNKCNGLSGTLSSVNPIPVPAGQGHQNTWATGILYNNSKYPNKVNYHTTAYTGNKTSVTSDSTDAIDKKTEEYQRFNERRNQENTVTVISDMLILQTSSGDQSVIYFETKKTATTQTNFSEINMKFEQMWENNSLSAAKWKEDAINIGSYNGQYYNTTSKYTGNGNQAQIKTAFDNDVVKSTGLDELGKARVVNSKTYSAGSGYKSSPSLGQYRMERPNTLRLYIDKIKQNPINQNGEYIPGQSNAYFKQILSYTNDLATGEVNVHEEDLTTNELNQFGYTIPSRYRISDNKFGTVNSIIIHDPVSVENATIVSLSEEMDQRTTIPEGSAQSMLDEIAKIQICPLSPALCEFRVKNCKYYTDTVNASFNFEKVNTVNDDDIIEDDTSIIRSLLKSSSGVTLDYKLPSTFTIRKDNQEFGTGRYLQTNGNQRVSMELYGLGLQFDKNLRIKVESNVYIPYSSSINQMLFSFDGLGFYLPAGDRNGRFITEQGNVRVANQSIVNSHFKLTVIFSFGSLSECEIYINDMKVLNYTNIGKEELFQEDTIGNNFNIGTWTKNNLYNTGFYLDNLTISRMAGVNHHTASCYDIDYQHDTVKQYTCGNKTSGFFDANHIHTANCTYVISKNNTHVHNSNCKEINIEVLQDALDAYENGDSSKLNTILGNELYQEFVNKYGTGSSSNGKVIAEFFCTGANQSVTLKKGVYLLEVWGAQGGKSQKGDGGLASYAAGELTLSGTSVIYAFIGGKGGDMPGSRIDQYDGVNNNGGFNGGGNGSGSAGPGGGGGTDFRLGGIAIANRILVAGGGGGGNGSDVVSNGVLFQGSNGCTSRHVSSYPNDEGGGGGGYYGGQTIHGDDPQAGYAGSSYTGTLQNGKILTATRSGNGYAKITSLITIPSAQEYKNEIANSIDKIPTTINGAMNPIFQCTGIYNTHVCNTNCTEIKALNCSEPHHRGLCYDYDNATCWDPCRNDNNHKTQTSTITTEEGKKIDCGSFICLDNYFQVYFPNRGDFKGTDAHGISNTIVDRGKGYVTNMSTLEWTREKRVKFAYDVLFNQNGVWRQINAGEWINLPLKDNSGKELEYYNFYCLLSNSEAIAASVEFVVEAINCSGSPGGKENPYLRDDYNNADCYYDIYNRQVTNKQRFPTFSAYHSAYKVTYTDVIGRIGNLIMEDTEDLRFSNLFKESRKTNNWIVEGLLHEVDTSISKNYLSWFFNDGSYGKDIRNVTVSKEKGMYNTYGTQKWTSKANAIGFPLTADKNIIASLRGEQLKAGYNILFDISTIGDYRNTVQVVPYFYALNTDTNTLTPVDVYMSVSGIYKPISYFGLLSDYVNPDNTLSDTYYQLKDTLYNYVMSLNWMNDAKRRNYTEEEEKITKYLSENYLESVTDSDGNVVAQKYLTIPFGDSYTLGTAQMLLAGTRARTFIGSSKVNSVNINGASETNISGAVAPNEFMENAQRWHLTLGVPSSVAYVAYRNKTHQQPMDMITMSNGEKINAMDEFTSGNVVILMTADIKAIGDRYTLGYDQGINNGVITINGKTYTFGNDIPTIIAIYDCSKSSAIDIDFIGSH